ncbi:MAG TPA: rhomboid family intramembrane serine protease [Vicinamibacterales bacterium]|nr:rhomboid family intramembrane serine protease [Vicinamibacterales bacterium]
MSRYGSVAYSMGPGPLSHAVRTLIAINVAGFVLSLIVPAVIVRLGLVPAMVTGQFALWQPVTYMFLHGGVGHLVFNMLALWMFGTELERTWGTRFFVRYYMVTGVGAALVTIAWSLSPLPYAAAIYQSVVIGASGAIYGLLLAYGLYFPTREIYLYFLFPIQARYFVILAGVIAFLSSVGSSGGGVAHVAHLGGLLVGYLYLKGRRGPLDEIKYQWLKWRLARSRSKFEVYRGGRSGPGSQGGDPTKEWKKHVH